MNDPDIVVQVEVSPAIFDCLLHMGDLHPVSETEIESKIGDGAYVRLYTTGQTALGDET